MKTKSNKVDKKLITKNTIDWYLQVGWHYCTITSPTKAREILNVDRTTWYRWTTGKAAAPYTALELLRLHAFGLPPGARSKAWHGVRFFNDRIITEDGREFLPEDLKAVFFWKQMAFQNLNGPDRQVIYEKLGALYRQA